MAELGTFIGMCQNNKRFSDEKELFQIKMMLSNFKISHVVIFSIEVHILTI